MLRYLTLIGKKLYLLGSQNNFYPSIIKQSSICWINNQVVKCTYKFRMIYAIFEVFLNEVRHSSSVAQAYVKIVYWDCTSVFSKYEVWLSELLDMKS